MNIFERREIIKDHLIDSMVAKTTVSQSRRKRVEAAKKLRKELAASRYAAVKADTISYPRRSIS